MEIKSITNSLFKLRTELTQKREREREKKTYDEVVKGEQKNFCT